MAWCLGTRTVQRCRVCNKRPQTFSSSSMCRVCINRLFSDDMKELNDYLKRWYDVTPST